jgi:uncharacterized protein YbcI
MSESESPHEERSVLLSISNAIVRSFKVYYGKGPVSTKTYMVDDLVFVVMREGLNPQEKFLIDQGEEDVVRAYRQTFENRMAAILTNDVERATGRKVLAFQSQILLDPDLTVEIFVLDDRGTVEGVEETAIGQLENDDAGAVIDERTDQI